MSVGGYHHHVGANMWESASGKPRTSDTAGLVRWEIVLPAAADVDALEARLGTQGVVTRRDADGTLVIHDPWQTELVIRSA
jgi:catechol 2,3-dioxygenase